MAYLAVGIQKPLSTIHLTLSLSIIVLIMLIAGYKINKESFAVNLELNFNNSYKFTVLLPLIFPFLAVLGTYVMGHFGSNLLLLFLIFLIAAYIMILAYLKNNISGNTYPIALLMISISLLFVHSLTSNYILGRDVYSEYFAFQMVLKNLSWNIANYRSVLTACLSSSLLPTIYGVLLNINSPYIFKLVYPLLFSITPLAVFSISKKYLNNQYAFFAALYFVFQLPFIDESQSMMRQIIAMVLFSLALMIFLEKELVNRNNGKIIFILLMFGVVVSHYTSAYIFLILFSILFLFNYVKFGLFRDIKTNLSLTLIILMFVFIFFWYSQLNASFNSTIVVINDTFKNLINFFDIEARDQSVLITMGQGISNIAEMIRIYTYDLTFIFIALGAIYSFFKCRKKLDSEFTILGIVCIALIVSFAVLPYINSKYGNARLFLQVTVIIAPFLVIGLIATAKKIKLKHVSYLILPLLLLQLFNVTFVTDQLLGIHTSVDLNNNGDRYNEFYIHDSEVSSARWLFNENKERSEVYSTNTSIYAPYKIYSDYFGTKRLSWGYLYNVHYFSFTFDSINASLIPNQEYYVYLWNYNTEKNEIYYRSFNKLEQGNLGIYGYLFKNSEKIYDNGFSDIYYHRGE
ncbi:MULTISPECIES: DUF2206 domain-containing protein [Methanobacterium]|uniref:DUF2206 domain-containing protein n=1 Tax=Methanobacterium veterum TaxID=408577 RepID=A0A9E5A3N3_9EURY|nr:MULTISPECIES: DUF2206 domain-containing protein [Methanobacterium]MCZ3367485.1 DUF2206 domain-containing protein [Methanobacterium veterum]MCZ3373367.1 DUF2206 domain-containing protein [Methanobacterium veterum]